MKKILLMTIAFSALVFASCSKESGKEAEGDVTQLTVRLAGVLPETRMTGTAGQTGQLKLNDGQIYIVNAAGSVLQSVVLDVAAATGAGQAIATPVPSDSRVYILGNVPKTVNTGSLTTLDQIKSTAVLISASDQNDYTKAALANASGDAVPLTVSGTTATVMVEISPLYSRMELNRVVGDSSIVSFRVTGVFVDSYYSSFTLGGGSAGVIWTQSQKNDFTGNIGDTGAWNSTGTPPNTVAVPATGQVWAYHIAAADLPRFIVRVENIVYNDRSGTQHTMSGVYYVTVTGYTGAAPTKFERGKIYQIQSVQIRALANSGGPANISTQPNPTNVTTTVQTKVIDWVATPLTPKT
ncbi:MAG: hypothetical protein LBR65_06525 [Culturomica sp.]|jgi:hypothetical protein|nr:hypothetical protein [Culturomica sp.]